MPARWKISGSVLTVLVGVALWLVFDSVALGLVFAIAIALSFGWWGSRGTGEPGSGQHEDGLGSTRPGR